MTPFVRATAFVFVAATAGALGLLAGGGWVVSPTQGAPASAPGWGSFATIVERANPAVVHIAVAENGGELPAAHRLPWGGPRRGEGSGFVVDPDGYIVTNHHVVAGSSRIHVRLADKRELAARVVGEDAHTDLALLKVDAADLPTLPLGSSDGLKVGDWVCAIGNPYRFDHSVTVGVVSSKGRKIWDASFDSFIQTDAAINPGNSGGPLLDTSGTVVGINSAVMAQGQGIGFAIPVDVAKDVIAQLRSAGRVARGYLGIQLQDLDPDLKRLVRFKDGDGVVVLDVMKGSAGEAAGLRRYDVITAVSGRKVGDGDQLVREIASQGPGRTVTLSVSRDGQPLSLDARLNERQAAEAAPVPAPHDQEPAPKGDRLGLVVKELSVQAQTELAIPRERSGVVVTEISGLSPGLEALEHGDVVVEINRRPTPDLASYERIVSTLKPGEVAWLFVHRTRPQGSFLARVEAEAE